ncbi:MAG TPA: tRNA (adenosine(37)-N6)-threonylcarbamoyltransferase complex dimerization subunit type 1 TsaB [Candidatus Sulfotelmatobacter sp.]|nr:tRNA (adenosine(37)-N6)-threonylcarbamoyltransferase complex dimerization subunit type 1 TsaB [Candidatus Sulfotelmatobacter sp.]
MLLLSTDTSGRQGSIALASGEVTGACQIIEVAPLPGGNFSAQLVPQIAALLARHGFNKTDLGAFAVASGPGSFTGLRVGLSAIKALAEILEKPVATVSLLEAIAVGAGLQGKILAILDAGRGDLYAGEYEVTGESAQAVTETLARKENVLVKMRESEPQTSAVRKSTLATPDQSLDEAARSAGLPVVLVEAVDAGAIARLGWRKIQAGRTVSPEQLEANYIRRTDAEIFAKVSC